jgi:hypothetical protein
MSHGGGGGHVGGGGHHGGFGGHHQHHHTPAGAPGFVPAGSGRGARPGRVRWPLAIVFGIAVVVLILALAH